MKSKRISIILLMVAFFASTSNNLIAQTPIQTEWSLNGNSINHGEFIGTVNQQPLRFCTNNNQRGIFSQYSGFFGIGINEPKNPLHKHLPGIPSASEVEEKGSVDLGEMNTLLLQKVEELTKYIIDLQKQIDELKNGKE